MSKKLQLTIPAPCNENWQEMTPVEKGRFCNSCQKQVVDFTRMSDAQVMAFFRKPATGSVCGRFMQDQLDRDLDLPRKRIPWFKYFFQFALPALLMSVKATAQGEPRIKRDTVMSEPSPAGSTHVKPGMVDRPAKFSNMLHGFVTDPQNKPLSNASVLIKGANLGVTTDVAGRFMIPLPDLTRKAVLQVSIVGFQICEQIVDTTSFQKLQIIRLQESVTTLEGEVIIVKKTKRKITPLIPQKDMNNTYNSFKVFPNPIPSGNNLNIELQQKMTEGYYRLEIVNASGNRVFRKEIWIDSEARVMDIETPALAAGNYVLSLVDRKSGKRFSEQLLITAR